MERFFSELRTLRRLFSKMPPIPASKHFQYLVSYNLHNNSIPASTFFDFLLYRFQFHVGRDFIR